LLPRLPIEQRAAQTALNPCCCCADSKGSALLLAGDKRATRFAYLMAWSAAVGGLAVYSSP
jgi:hypothetical protein